MTRQGRILVAATVIISGALAAACSSADAPTDRPGTPNASQATTRSAAAHTSRADAPRIVILGDSLTAGYGLDKAQAFPALLQQRLDAAGHRYEVVNAGVSGDTTAGGVRRLDWSMEGNTRLLVVALGANDGLRGLPVADARRNLDEIITRAQQRGITVILAGMEAPPNYGPQYTAEFRNMYRDLAKQHRITLIPFLLEGVAGIPSLNIADGIHPNPEGARLVERIVWSAIEPALESPATR